MECEHTPSGFFAAMYFVLFMCTVAFLILNLFIGTYARPTPLALPSASLLSPLRPSCTTLPGRHRCCWMVLCNVTHGRATHHRAARAPAGIITTEMQDAKQEAERQRKVSGKLAIAAAMRIRAIDTPNPVADAFDVEGGLSTVGQSFDDEK
jgi:hypothetical protein